MFTKQLSREGHTIAFSILRTEPTGWEVREERDSEIVRRALYRDWHRVERAMERFSTQVATLLQGGWEIHSS